MTRLVIATTIALFFALSNVGYANTPVPDKKTESETNAVRVVVTNYKQDEGLTGSDKIALASGFVAFLALAATFWQGALARRHNRLSIRPIIDIYTDRQHNYFLLSMQNFGIGPALIDSLLFTDMNTKMSYSVKQFSAFLIDQTKAPEIEWDEMTLGEAVPLPPGNSTDLIKIHIDESYPEDVDIVEKIAGQFRVVVKYRCLYDNHFIYDDFVDATVHHQLKS